MVPLFRRTRVIVASTCALAALGVGVPTTLGLAAVDAATPKKLQSDANAGDVHHVVAAHARRVAIRARRDARRVAVPPALQAIAQCESGSDPKSVSADGTYRGKYQFSHETWASQGGHGDPAAAPEAEQDKRAMALYDSSGPGQWPVCGR